LIKFYNEVLKAEPEYLFSCYKNRSALENLGRWEKAIEWIDKATEIDPNDALIKKKLRLLRFIYKKRNLV
jgi:tetratricopeptide (TPR) repeat protein